MSEGAEQGASSRSASGHPARRLLEGVKKQTTGFRQRRFERIVVLVDITVVLLQYESKKLFAAHVFNSVSRILRLCDDQSESPTLWGYKFFDPCHSPLASRIKIGNYLGEGSSVSEQFDAFGPNLEKFGKALHSMVSNDIQYSFGYSRGDYVARTITEVICNYTWDPLLASDISDADEEPLASNERPGGDCANRDSNAIILFSSVPTTWTGANFFFNAPEVVREFPPQCSVQGLLANTFRTVREALKGRNIEIRFVDVPMHQGLWSDERLETVLKPAAPRRLILKALSDLVRTVIASDLLVVSPGLLPCSLLWNTVADLGIEKHSKKSRARVLCQEGVTLLCEVQLQHFNVVHTFSRSKEMSVPKAKLLLPATDILDIVLESVQPKNSPNMKLTSERFLVRQSVHPKVSLVGEDRNSFGDQVLQLLDRSAFRPGQPGWQLLLLTLASKNLVCEVSLRIHEDGHCLKAVLEPFTSHCAILTVFERDFTPTKTDIVPSIKIETNGESVSGQGENTVKRRKDTAHYATHEGVKVIGSRKRRKVEASDEAENYWQVYWEREGTTSVSTEVTSDHGTLLSRYIGGGGASQSLQGVDSLFKERPQPNRVIDLVVPLAVMDIGVELSADHTCAPSAHPLNSDALVHPGLVSGQNAEAIEFDFVQVVSKVLAGSDATSQGDSNAVVGENTPAHEADPSLSMACHTPAQEADPIPSVAYQMTSEEAREYIASVGRKVEDYLTSTDVDRPRFAGMLVTESYKSLSVLTKQIEDDQQRSDTGEPAELHLNRKIAVRLKRLLLKSHNGLLAKYRNCVGSRSGPTSGASVDDKVKEFELQILLRLEMMSFDEGRLLQQPAKVQLVNDVCKLLDSIQFQIGGGIFGGQDFLNYCDQLLVRRYRNKIPSIISKIHSEMELDGYSLLPPSDSAQESNQDTSLKVSTAQESNQDTFLQVSTAQESNQETSLKVSTAQESNQDTSLQVSTAQESNQDTSLQVSTYTGDLLLGEAGVSQDSVSFPEGISTSASGGLPSVSWDPRGQVRSRIFGKGTKKKGSYHFSDVSSLRRLRTFKSGGRGTSAHSKASKESRKPKVSVNDDPFQVVCQTPAPVIAPSFYGADDLPQLATLAAPKDLAGFFKDERVCVEQPPSVVEGTPVVRRRLTLHSFGQEDATRSSFSLDEMVADIDRTSDAVPNRSAACPSTSFGPEPSQNSVSPEVSVDRKQGVRSDDLSFSSLLRSVLPGPPRTEVAALGYHRGTHICHIQDDDLDDDEDGIISTPFKINRGGRSGLAPHSSLRTYQVCP